MKTKIKITIEGNTFEIESTYENGVDNIIKVIEVITKQQILNVAKKKMVDMNASSLEACASMVAGSALSMGLEVIE